MVDREQKLQEDTADLHNSHSAVETNLKAQLAEQDERIKGLLREYEDQENELAHRSKLCEDTSNLLQEAKEEIIKLRPRETAAASTQSEVVGSVYDEKLELMTKKIEDTKEQSKKDLKDALEALESLQARYDTLSNHSGMMLKSNDNRLETLENTKDNLTQQISVLKQQPAEIAEELERVRRDLATAEEKLAFFANVRNQKFELETETRKLREEYDATSSSHSSAIKLVADLQAEKKRSQEEFENFKSEAAAQQSAIKDEANAAATKMQKEKDELLAKKCAELEEQMAKKCAELETCLKNLASAQTHVSQLEPDLGLSLYAYFIPYILSFCVHFTF